MSDVQYPFIDVAVHDRVSEAFAAGMAVVLFSADLRSVSWANGRGAALFGFASIYDFLDQGLDRGELMFRQVEPVARSLSAVGDRRTFTVRIASGFLRVAVQARCEMITVQNKSCILLCVPLDNQKLSLAERAARLIEGFDDPETHMAVLDEQGAVLAQSGQFPALAISVQTTRMLVSMVGNDRHRLIKRPVSTSGGYLPAAIGQVSEDPALNLLFVVGATRSQDAAATAPASTEAVVPEAPAIVAPALMADAMSAAIETAEITSGETPDYEDALSAVAAIEDNPEIEEEISLEGTPDAAEPADDMAIGDEPDAMAAASDAADLFARDEPAADGIGEHAPQPGNAGEDALHGENLQADDVIPFPDETMRAADDAEAETDDAAEPLGEMVAPEEPIAFGEAEQAHFADMTGGEPAEEQDATLQHAGETTIVDDTASDDTAADQAVEAHDQGNEPVEAHHSGETAAEDDDAALGLTAHGVSEEASVDTSEAMPEVAPEAMTEQAPVLVDDDAELAPVADEKFEPQLLMKTVRFVWKIDASGRFSEVSREFADAVGPHAADISGMAFSDLAALFNLDPDGKIAELLGRRDTWSGRTIWWPVEGTSLVVPVDLAALPTYTRAREFDGFRGFGIVRMGDAAEDPSAAGLSLGNPQLEDTADVGDVAEAPATAGEDHGLMEAEAPVASEPAAEAVADHAGVTDDAPEETGNDAARDTLPQEHYSADDQEQTTPASHELEDDAAATVHATADDGAEHVAANETDADRQPEDEPVVIDEAAHEWPAGEPPALRLVDNPGRRISDKVIHLEEHRSRLSPGEQANFQEIARRLDTFVRSTEDAEAGDKLEPAATVAKDEHQAAATPSTTVTDDHDHQPSQASENENDGSDVAHGEDHIATADASTSDSEVEAYEAEHGSAPAPAAGPEQTGSQQADVEETGADTVQAAGEIAEPETHGVEELSDAVSGDDFAGHDAADESSVGHGEAEHSEGDEREQVETGHLPSPADAAALAAMMPGRDRIGLSEEIIDQMPVALLVHAGDRLIHANGEFLKMTGYPTLEALADIGGLDALLQRQELEDKTAHAGGMVVVRADDVIVPVTARLQSIRWNDASALMLALMPVAAAEPEHTETSGANVLPLRPLRTADQLAKLQVEVEEMRAILETATDGVVIIGADGEIRSLNRAASALFNFDAEEINGKPFVTLFAHESQRAIIDYLAGLSGHGVASVLNDGREVIGREASGGFIPLFMTIGRLTSSNGYCAVIRDITQWKRTEEELRTAKRAAETANAHKSEFLAHVSHEIRTPLNAIIGFADMMASERLGPVGHPRYIEYSNDIGRSGRHVLDIVNDLLDISKIEAGELDLDFVSVGLNETVSEAVSLVQPQANGQRVIIRTSLSQTVPQVVADLRSIKQIVLNILSNAIRFTPSGGQIVVSTAYEANGSVVLRIRDTGIGMTRAELELAMKPFRQVAGASRKRGDGTGLGLPLTKAMVDANRANFSISSAPNEGTLVEITFPSQRVLAS